MNNQIQNFLNYLLDSETTSEIAFIETIQKNNELFQLRHLKDWEQTVFAKIQQLHRTPIISTLLNSEDHRQKSENESSEDDSATAASSSTDDDDDDETEEVDKDKKSTENKHVNINFFFLII